MKKTILASLLILSAAGVAFAQTADNNGGCKGRKAKCEQAGCPAAQQQCPNPFEGLNLTAEQQTKLDALRAECQRQKTADREQAKADRKEAKQAAKQAQTEKRKEMLAKVKEILTPEQYNQFLENNFVNGGHKMKAEGHRGDKGRSEAKNLDRKAKGERRGQAGRPQNATQQ